MFVVQQHFATMDPHDRQGMLGGVFSPLHTVSSVACRLVIVWSLTFIGCTQK